MPDCGDTTQSVPPHIIRCLACGTYIPSKAVRCPTCDTVVAPGTVEILARGQVSPSAPTVPHGNRDTDSFLAPDASVVFRLLEGEVFSVSIQQPLILGRATGTDVNTLFDLTEHHGQEFGVSRQHCKLFRQGTRLFVADLGSTNGTFLNDRQLSPYEQHKVSHGDRLVLGTLQILILFSNKG